MVVNGLQNDLITHSPKGWKTKLSKFFAQIRTHTFFSNPDREFYSESSNISQVYTYIPKIQKKSKKKNTTIVYAQIRDFTGQFCWLFATI
jgi:hypothetical protein